MQAQKLKSLKHWKRHMHVRKKISGTAARPRLAIFRSAKHVYAQLIDDVSGKTLAGATSVCKELRTTQGTKTALATEVGKQIGDRAKACGIEQVVFDRGGFPYHGRVKAIAEGARAAGLKF